MDCTYAEQMDPGYPLAAFITVVGMAGAYRLGRRQRRAAPVKAICPCKHAISFHKDLVGGCKAIVGKGLILEQTRCRCERYAGPELIGSLTMRPIAEDT